MRVKEITKEMVGREARRDHWDEGKWITVLAVHENYLWALQEKGLYGNFNNGNDWILKDLPAPKKLPSERIKEIVGDSQFGWADAIMKYLDEASEQKEKGDE